jgi:hypothetical protein
LSKGGAPQRCAAFIFSRLPPTFSQVYHNPKRRR